MDNILNGLGSIYGAITAKAASVGNKVTSTAKNAYQQAKNNLPYTIANTQIAMMKHNLPHEVDASYWKKFNNEYQSATPQEKLYLPLKNASDALDDYGKTSAAQLRPLDVGGKTDPGIAGLLEHVLSSPAFSDAAKQYFSQIPINYNNIYSVSDRGYMAMPAGMAQGIPSQNYVRESSAIGRDIPVDDANWDQQQFDYQSFDLPQIGINMKYYAPMSGYDGHGVDVLRHELLHTAPRQLGSQKSQEEAMSGITKDNNPDLYKGLLTYFGDGRVPPNTEEAFAQLGTIFGPAILQDPTVGEFYQGIFTPPKHPYSLQGIAQQISDPIIPTIMNQGPQSTARIKVKPKEKNGSK